MEDIPVDEAVGPLGRFQFSSCRSELIARKCGTRRRKSVSQSGPVSVDFQWMLSPKFMELFLCVFLARACVCVRVCVCACVGVCVCVEHLNKCKTSTLGIGMALVLYMLCLQWNHVKFP